MKTQIPETAMQRATIAQRSAVQSSFTDCRRTLNSLDAMQALADSSPRLAQLQARSAVANPDGGVVQRVIVTQTGTTYKRVSDARAQVRLILQKSGISRRYLDSLRVKGFIERAVERARNSARRQEPKKIAAALKAILANHEKRQRKLGIKMRNIGRDLRRKTPYGRGNVVTDLNGPNGAQGYIGAAKNYHLTNPGQADYSKYCAIALNQNQAANCDQYGNAMAYLLHQRGINANVMANNDIKHTFAVAGHNTLHETFGDAWVGQAGSASEMHELGAHTYQNSSNPIYPVATTDPHGGQVDPFQWTFPNPVPQQVIDDATQRFQSAQATGFSAMYDQSAMRVGADVSDDEDDAEQSDTDDPQEEDALRQLD